MSNKFLKAKICKSGISRIVSAGLCHINKTRNYLVPVLSCVSPPFNLKTVQKGGCDVTGGDNSGFKLFSTSYDKSGGATSGFTFSFDFACIIVGEK